jgi:hypothetical protein
LISSPELLSVPPPPASQYPEDTVTRRFVKVCHLQNRHQLLALAMSSTGFINAYCFNIQLARRFSLLVNPIGLLSSELSTLFFHAYPRRLNGYLISWEIAIHSLHKYLRSMSNRPETSIAVPSSSAWGFRPHAYYYSSLKEIIDYRAL